MRGTCLSSFILVLACLHSCVAWWETGHMLVAQIGYNYLVQHESEDTRAALQNSLDALQTYSSATSTFVTSAVWMDDLKTRAMQQLNSWHFINLPYCIDNVTFCNNNPPNTLLEAADNVVWAIQQANNGLTSKYAGGFERGFALKNLLHLVGDLHQPLHCVALYSNEAPNGDQGGNLFYIANYTGLSNLHALWDAGAGLFNNNIIRPLNTHDQEYIENMANEIMSVVNVSAIATDVSAKAVAGWSMEGLELAKTVVYTLGNNTAPSPEYIQNAQAAIKQQIGKAGIRLAYLLKQIALCDPKNKNCPTSKPKDDKAVYVVITAILCAALVVSVIINIVIVHKNHKRLAGEKDPLLKP